MLASSVVGSVASIIATAPLEVVKVRTQSVSGKVSMMSVIKTTLLKEGISALFRGTTARIIFRAPKTATAFWALHQGERLIEEKKESTEEKQLRF